MGKSKNDNSMTHEEIWDDSALVRSWDEAVEEYQLYHSIHAKGENVEDVLKEAEQEGFEGEPSGPPVLESQDTDVPMEGETGDNSTTNPNAQVHVSQSFGPQVTTSQESAPVDTTGPKFPTGAMPIPEPVLSSVQDENLKQLMMAWYFAGYYTGLYEGKQQAANQTR